MTMTDPDPGLPEAIRRLRLADEEGGNLDPEGWWTAAAIAAREDVPDLIRQATADALRDLISYCFDDRDAGCTVGGIDVVWRYVYETIADLTGAPEDVTNRDFVRNHIRSQDVRP